MKCTFGILSDEKSLKKSYSPKHVRWIVVEHRYALCFYLWEGSPARQRLLMLLDFNEKFTTLCSALRRERSPFGIPTTIQVCICTWTKPLEWSDSSTIQDSLGPSLLSLSLYCSIMAKQLRCKSGSPHKQMFLEDCCGIWIYLSHEFIRWS